MLNILLWILGILAAYIVISSLLHYVFFPLKYPAFSDYFKPGDVLYTYDAGVKQIIERIEGDKAFGTIIFEPLAAGPVEHLHKHFDEVALIEGGELSTFRNGEKVVFKKGERMEMKRGISHKLFNEASTETILRSDESVGIPAAFMYCTAQLNGLVQKDPRNKKTLRLLIYASMFGKLFDLYPAGKGSPPPFLVQILKFLIAPTARLFGYKGYYEDIIPERKP